MGTLSVAPLLARSLPSRELGRVAPGEDDSLLSQRLQQQGRLGCCMCQSSQGIAVRKTRQWCHNAGGRCLYKCSEERPGMVWPRLCFAPVTATRFLSHLNVDYNPATPMISPHLKTVGKIMHSSKRPPPQLKTVTRILHYRERACFDALAVGKISRRRQGAAAWADPAAAVAAAPPAGGIRGRSR